ncbi:MAG: cysteine hydrolase [Acidobacteriales bacterium]|nr:cysteine hydrolase [Terriglobales bacterium]
MALSRTIKLDAQPVPIELETSKTALVVVDMQNDFGSQGGMFDRAGIDITGIRKVIAPIANVLSAARGAGVQIVYLKMGFLPDLSDLGTAESPNRVRHLYFGVGNNIQAPDGSEGRILIRDTWNTDIVAELTPQQGDIVLYKNRFSGFYQTRLDETLKQLGITTLMVTGCTTSVCVESTIRDAMFRDYRCVLLADCAAEPIGQDFPRSNHEASLLVVQTLLGWISESRSLLNALGEGYSSLMERAG